MPESSQRSFKVVIRGSIQDVWREITRTDAPIACFFNSRMHVGRGKLEAGSKLAMRTPDGKYTGVVGEILEFTPPRRFAHTFRFTQLDDPPCKVVYELREVPAGTEFTLMIEDLTEGTKSAKQMVGGSQMIIATLKEMVERGRPSLVVRGIFLLMKLTQPMTPKRCLSEHWPVG